jgi:hypothetical protein
LSSNRKAAPRRVDYRSVGVSVAEKEFGGRGGKRVTRADAREEAIMDELYDNHVEIDERWLTEWFEFGFAELSSYLAKHAAFDAFCDKHELD